MSVPQSLASFALLATLAACMTDEGSALDLRDQRQAVLDRISDRCGLPRTTLVLVDVDRLEVRNFTGVSFEQVECQVSGLKAANLPITTTIIGNEAYNR